MTLHTSRRSTAPQLLVALACALLTSTASAGVAKARAKTKSTAKAKPAKASRTAALVCTPLGPTVRTTSFCRYGAPVVVGKTLFVPKACRLPLSSGPIERHAVELRDAATGRKQGQASLPAKKTTMTTAPRPGALIGGPYPLYVWGGGIAAIDTSSKRARSVFEATGTLAAVARYGEVMALVDTLPADKTFPKGSLEWTVLDFGAGELLGQLRLARAPLRGIGLAMEPGKQGRQLVAWLRAVGSKGERTVVAPVRDALGKSLAQKGSLRARAEAPKGRTMPLASRASGRRSAPATPCPALSGRDAVLTATPLVDVSAKAANAPASAGTTLAIPACLAASAPTREGLTWAWTAPKPGTLTLSAFRCAPAGRAK